MQKKVKINNISIKGIRGIKDKLELPLNGKSILLYGDNGNGKSSISDSLEWFFTDKVSHLSGAEIDLKDALRNSTYSTSDVSEITFSFSKNDLDSTKSIRDRNGKLASDNTNVTDDFIKYISDSRNENLLLRYKHLTDFIDDTKTEKLKYLSDIIGFSEVTKKKDVLRKSYSGIKTLIKNQNFESLISVQKQTLINKLGAAITEDENLIQTINQKIEPLNLKLKVEKIEDIVAVLEILKQGINKELIEESKFLEDVNNELQTLKSEIDFIDSEYSAYYTEFDKIAKDVKSIMQTFLGELLNSANLIIDKKFHTDNNCPVCLQPKDLFELQEEIKLRLKEIEEASKKKAIFDDAKRLVNEMAVERIRRLDLVLKLKWIESEANSEIKTSILNLKSKINEYLSSSNEKVTSGKGIPEPKKLKLNLNDFSFQTAIIERHKKIIEVFKKNNPAELYEQISSGYEAFVRIKGFDKQKERLEKQRNTLEIVYNQFIIKQKEGLENFISTFSGTINDYYQFMNPDEPFQDIKIVTIGDEDELNGLTIEYKYNGKWVSPPEKYFSESHLNCFGLSFFLASVDAFNDQNDFILLDDVISSFDSTHRKRFAELLFEKFSKRQLILLTHEWDWYFNFVRPLAKKKGWLIKEIKWSDSKGTHFDETPSELKELIEWNMAEGNLSSLGNPLRIYLESMLKSIALNIDAKLGFRYNDDNEHRMPTELLKGIRSEIKKCSTELKEKSPVFDRIENSSILGNICSHDNPFNPSSGDLKAFWSDIHELNDIFTCSNTECKRPNVSLKDYDTTTNKIRCGCDEVKYAWKKN